MNGYSLLKAIGDIDDSYILSAQKHLGYLDPEPIIYRPHRLRKVFVALVAAIIMLFSTVTVAMAASEEFREAVYAFLGIKQATVPIYQEDASDTPGKMAVEPMRTNISGLIEGIYVHFPEASHARNGMFFACTDQQMMNDGNHYDAYFEENGNLIKLEEHFFSQDYTILGNELHIEFQWVEHNGICSFTYIDPRSPCRMWCLSGPPEAVLMTFEFQLPGGGSTEYPMLVNLWTGELTDILAGTGAESLPSIYTAAISEDKSKMVLVDNGGQLFYADLNAKKLYNVEALSGQRADACSLIGGTLACWALNAPPTDPKDPETYKCKDLGTYEIWTIDLDTMERRELFSSLPATAATSYSRWSRIAAPFYHYQEDGATTLLYPDENGEYTLTEPPLLPNAGLHFIGGFSMTSYWGNMYAGSCFAVETDADRNVFVIDLRNGERTKIEGYQIPDEPLSVSCIPSPDGRKLLLYSDQADGSTPNGCISSVGVLDFDRKVYLEFSRENLNNVQEHGIYWFDNSQILIVANPLATDGTSEYYIYKLTY